MIGKQILNYTIKSILGEGGMGTVYLAQHLSIDRKVAIKVLKPELTQKEEIKNRFKNEASLMAQLQHPNIVGLIDYYEDEEGLYLIMEYVSGIGLDDLLKSLTQPLPIDRAINIFKKILTAFAYAHKNGIVHRDVKPSNILVTANDEVKVLDFGIAKLIGDSQHHLTRTGTQIGTVYYMSPEQVKAQEVDQRSDIYSLGVTFYEMLAGFSPYTSMKSEYEIYNSIVSEPLLPLTQTLGDNYTTVWAVIVKATEKEKEKRFSCCEELIQDLDRKKQVVREEPKPLEPTVAPEPKKTNYAPLIGVFVFLLVALVGYFIWQNLSSQEEVVTTISEKVWVLAPEMILRDTSNSDATVLTSVPFGSEIELFEEKTEPIFEGKFYHVWQRAKINDQMGWIAVSIDNQATVGTEKQVEQIRSLWGGDYDVNAEFASTRRWAQYAVRDFLETKGWTGKYRFKMLSRKWLNNENVSILKYHTSDDFDNKEYLDYVILLESTVGEKPLAIMLKADKDGQGGIVSGFCFLTKEASFFGYTFTDRNKLLIEEIYVYNKYGEFLYYLDDQAAEVYYTSKYDFGYEDEYDDGY